MSAAVIGSTTYEEAPARVVPWIRQRTRWFKGWMQTWLVHMRHPLRIARELGLSGFLAFQLVVGGTVLSALVHPIFIAQFVLPFATNRLFSHRRQPLRHRAFLALRRRAHIRAMSLLRSLD